MKPSDPCRRCGETTKMATMSMSFPPPAVPPPLGGSASRTGTSTSSWAWPAPSPSHRAADRAHIPSLFDPARTRSEEAEEVPDVDRPERIAAFRIVLGALGFVGVVLAWQVAVGASSDRGASEASLRRASVLIAATYTCAHLVFAAWSYRYRRIIDDFRWRSFRSTNRTGSWSFAWAVTMLAALSVFSLLAVTEAHVALFVIAGSSLVVTRMAMLRALGEHMARVVLGARRRTGLWGAVISAADLLVIGIFVVAFVDIEPRPDALSWVAGWAVFALVDVGVGLLSYMKRVERWTLAWWEYKVAPLQPAATAGVGSTEGSVDTPREPARENAADRAVAAARLLPVVVLRYVVVISYWLVAAAALRAGLSVGMLRGELTLATNPAAALDRISRSVEPFIVAVVVMQVAQGLWSVAQAHTSRRATNAAPNPVWIALLFIAGPAVLVYGLVAHPEYSAAFAAFALLLNLACWVCSFSALSQTLQDLGRSARTMATWSVVVSMHWILGFLVGPLASLDDDLWYATAIVVLSIVDAAVVVAASVHAWHAMRGMELALLDHDGHRERIADID